MELAYAAFFVVAGASSPADYSAFAPPIVAREVATARPFDSMSPRQTYIMPATTARHAVGSKHESQGITPTAHIRTGAIPVVRLGDIKGCST